MRLDPLPAGPVLPIGDLNALRLQLVPNPVRLGKVFGLLSLVALQNQRVDSRVPLAGDGIAASGLGRRSPGLLLPDFLRLFQQVQGQHRVKVPDQRQLGGVGGLGLQFLFWGTILYSCSVANIHTGRIFVLQIFQWRRYAVLI